MKEFDYLIWKEDNLYVSKCLNVEVSSFGETKEEALDMLKDALNLYFEENESELIPVQDAELGKELLNA
jgi:predicted RNase H-like HicB family nuclease